MHSGYVSVFQNLNYGLIRQYEGKWSLKKL